jgi:hypothetical protein
MRSSLVRIRSSLVRMRSSLMRIRSSLVVRVSDCQCTSCNGPGFDPSIRRHSGIWGAADEAVLDIVRNHSTAIKPLVYYYILCYIAYNYHCHSESHDPVEFINIFEHLSPAGLWFRGPCSIHCILLYYYSHVESSSPLPPALWNLSIIIKNTSYYNSILRIQGHRHALHSIFFFSVLFFLSFEE